MKMNTAMICECTLHGDGATRDHIYTKISYYACGEGAIMSL